MLTVIGNDDTSKSEAVMRVNVCPNPCNSIVDITIRNLKGGDLDIAILDVGGRLVKRILKNQLVEGGDIKAAWDATDTSGKKVSSGIYFARVSTPQTAQTIKLVLLR
jgi:flagellar hook assembly protein FlgD